MRYELLRHQVGGVVDAVRRADGAYRCQKSVIAYHRRAFAEVLPGNKPRRRSGQRSERNRVDPRAKAVRSRGPRRRMGERGVHHITDAFASSPLRSADEPRATAVAKSSASSPVTILMGNSGQVRTATPARAPRVRATPSGPSDAGTLTPQAPGHCWWAPPGRAADRPTVVARSTVWSTSAASAKLKITTLVHSPPGSGRKCTKPVIMAAWGRAPYAVQREPWPLGAGFMPRRGGWRLTAAPLRRPALHGLDA